MKDKVVITRLPIELETPLRDWREHAIRLCNLQNQIGGVCVLGPLPRRLPNFPNGQALVINCVLPIAILKLLWEQDEVYVHKTWVACAQLW